MCVYLIVFVLLQNNSLALLYPGYFPLLKKIQLCEKKKNIETVCSLATPTIP